MEQNNSVATREYILEKTKIILDSYNKLFIKGFDEEVSDIKREIHNKCAECGKDKVLEDQLYTSIFSITNQMKSTIYNTWKCIPMDDLGGKSITDFFNDINDIDLLIEVLELFCRHSDYDFPDVLMQKIHTFGEQASNKIVSSMLDHKILLDNISEGTFSEEDFLVPLFAIKILGKWKAEKAVMPIIEFFLELTDKENQGYLDKKYELVALFGENVRAALISFGAASISPLLIELARPDKYSEAHDYFAMALAEIGSKNNSEEIYQCLKRTFLKHDNKMIIAECMSVYGDGRAVTFLRGYLERNIKKINNDALYTFKLAIEKLGGSINDILANRY